MGKLELSSQLLKTSSNTRMILSQVLISCLFTRLRELGADWLALAIIYENAILCINSPL